MGFGISKAFDRLWGKRELHIVMVGLYGAGKTTIIYKLKLGEVVTTIPTIGFNVDSVKYKNIKFDIWDVGENDRIRPFWSHYFQNTQAIIFVVDSNDRDRIPQAREELHLILDDENLRDAILLVFANKQDGSHALSTGELTDQLGLRDLGQRGWHIQAATATNGDGLYEGLEWVSDSLRNAGVN